MKTKKLLFYLLAALLGGCIPVMSLHPLYTEEDVVFEKKLLGTWVDDFNDTLEFKRFDKSEKAYELIYSDDKGHKGSWLTNLVKLQNMLLLNVYPSQVPCGGDPNRMEWAHNMLFFMPVHTFIKIGSIEPQLRLQLTDDDDMKKLLKENPNAIKHEFVEGKPVLTASTKELQAFVLKYANDSRVFPTELVLTRKKAEAPQQSGKTAVRQARLQ